MSFIKRGNQNITFYPSVPSFPPSHPVPHPVWGNVACNNDLRVLFLAKQHIFSFKGGLSQAIPFISYIQSGGRYMCLALINCAGSTWASSSQWGPAVVFTVAPSNGLAEPLNPGGFSSPPPDPNSLLCCCFPKCGPDLSSAGGASGRPHESGGQISFTVTPPATEEVQEKLMTSLVIQ